MPTYKRYIYNIIKYDIFNSFKFESILFQYDKLPRAESETSRLKQLRHWVESLSSAVIRNESQNSPSGILRVSYIIDKKIVYPFHYTIHHYIYYELLRK